MDYKERYNAALERMKSWVRGEHPECFSEAQKAAEFIFPELKESEDKKIRKSLINFLKSPFVHENITDEKVAPWIAWLEKQGHMLDPDKVIEWLNDQACQGWIEDVEVDKFVDKFKKDFGLSYERDKNSKTTQ